MLVLNFLGFSLRVFTTLQGDFSRAQKIVMNDSGLSNYEFQVLKLFYILKKDNKKD